MYSRDRTSQLELVYDTFIENISSFIELCSFFASYIKQFHAQFLELLQFGKRLYFKDSCLVSKKIVQRYFNLLLKRANYDHSIFELFVIKLADLCWDTENFASFFVHF